MSVSISKLLLWKNFHVVFRTWESYMYHLVIPLLIAGLIMIFRVYFPLVTMPERTYKKVELNNMREIM